MKESTMKERSILFSAPMVRALLDGSKTQTRRVVKRSEEWPLNTHHVTMLETRGTAMAVDGKRQSYSPEIKCPYGMLGGRLWVRETFAHAIHALAPIRDEHGPLVYAATDPAQTWLQGKWKPSIFMPRWASRITLEVTGVCVERLQDISEADAKAEGAIPNDGYAGIEAERAKGWIKSYEQIWESINGPSSWAANPWVWVIEFKVLPK